MNVHSVQRQIGRHTLSIETGKLGRQAEASVLVRYADTIVFTAVVTGPPREGIDFFPLTVDYREKTYAAGKFPGGFFKRETRPTTKEILTMRMVDRPIRPLFPDGFKDEVLIQSMVLSTDQQNDPDILAMVGASAALTISSLPFEGPTGSCRVGYVDGQYVLNPTEAEMEFSTLELVLAGHKGGVNMIEVKGHELPEEVVYGAIEFGYRAVQEVCEMIEELAAKAGKPKKWEAPPADDELKARLRAQYETRFREAKNISGKLERNEATAAIYKEAKEACDPEKHPDAPDWAKVNALLDAIEADIIAEMIVNEGKRPDGRGALDIRPIHCEVNVLPRVHGSALFSRGETQSLCVVTLGTGKDEQIIDGLTEEYSKKFMLHYNFPPFCTGEVKRVGAPTRREIGHGNLAEKSLENVLPSPEKFPYTIRLVSEIFESNGSSSMASVCGGCLALMDAGVPIRQPVAGISVGWFAHGGKNVLVVDILGEEDHHGLMDFKVAGTHRGITGVQLDLKARAIPMDLINDTLKIAKDARVKILRKMVSVLDRPRAATSEHAPRLLQTRINPEKIGKLIGPGGKGIRAIEAATGATVEIEDDGSILIACMNAAGAEKALSMVEAVAEEVKIGKVYTGRVISIRDFGAFIEISPGVDGMCHISELDTGYVKTVDSVVKVGDEVRVKVINVDDQGRVKLSRKALLLEEKAKEKQEPATV